MWFQPTAKGFFNRKRPSWRGKSEHKSIHVKRAVTICVEKPLGGPSHPPLALGSTTTNEHTSFVCNSCNSNYDYLTIICVGGMDVHARKEDLKSTKHMYRTAGSLLKTTKKNARLFPNVQEHGISIDMIPIIIIVITG